MSVVAKQFYLITQNDGLSREEVSGKHKTTYYVRFRDDLSALGAAPTWLPTFSGLATTATFLNCRFKSLFANPSFKFLVVFKVREGKR